MDDRLPASPVVRGGQLLPGSAPETAHAHFDPTGAIRSVDGLARSFRKFADQECADEHVYDALCRAAAEDPDTLRLLWHAPAAQQRANLLLAAVHDVILGGADHPLRDYFPSAGGTRSVDRELVACFIAFRDAHGGELIERIASRTTQTNEIGRCAILWLALQHAMRRHGRHEIALLDFGCSAGLNLGFDLYRYGYGLSAVGPPETPETPVIHCRPIGVQPVPATVSPPLRVVQRAGIDVAPIDVRDDDAMRWLRACLWPHDLERARRFDQAVQLARRHVWPVRRERDCITAVESWVREQPPDVLKVVWNCWVLTYLDPDARARYAKTLERLASEQGVVWLSAEAPALRLYAGELPPPCLAGAEYDGGTVWTMCSEGAHGPRHEVLARAHPHGKWVEWLVHRP